MEGKVTYTRLKSMYKKIQKSMNMSNKKQKNIQKLEKKLYEEIRPAMVDVHKQEISIKKNEKEEFDEMTKAAVIDAKKQILILKENEEKKFQKSLLAVVGKKNDARDTINVEQGLVQTEEEKLEEMKTKMDLLRNDHEIFVDELKAIEDYINRLALEFGIYDEINRITIEEAKETEKEAIQKAKEERKNKKEEKEKNIRIKEEKEKREIEKLKEENEIKKEEEFKKRLKELQEKEKIDEEYLDDEHTDEDIESISEIAKHAIEEQEEQEHLLKIDKELEEYRTKKIEEELEKLEEVKYEPIEFKSRYYKLDNIEGEGQEKAQWVSWEAIKEREELKEKKTEVKTNIEIEYDSKRDMYILKDIDLNNILEEKRTNTFDLLKFAEDRGIDSEYLINIDPCIVQILEKYDDMYGTNKSKEYIKEANLQAKSKKERKNDMEDINISISYDLKNLYDNIEEDRNALAFSEKERKELLTIAEKAEELGLANVKKGLYVSFRKKIDNIVDRIINFKNKLLLPEGKKANNKEDEIKEDIENKKTSPSQQFRETYNASVNYNNNELIKKSEEKSLTEEREETK